MFYNETQSLFAQYLLCQKTWCFYTILDQKCRTDDLFPSLHLHLSLIPTWYIFFSLSLFIWHYFFNSVWHRLWILCLFFQFVWLLECHIILQLEKRIIFYAYIYAYIFCMHKTDRRPYIQSTLYPTMPSFSIVKNYLQLLASIFANILDIFMRFVKFFTKCWFKIGNIFNEILP